MTKPSIRLCRLCSHHSCKVLHTQRFVSPQGYPLPSGYDVVCCEKCGFVYADTAASQEDCDGFYAECSKYEDNATATGGGGTACDAERLHQTATCLADFLPDKEARILDIGCANGGLLRALKDLEYKNLAGMDPSPTCVRNTVEYVGVQAFVGSLSSIDGGPKKYDCVILSHVLEHIHDLQGSANCIENLMADAGVLYIEVPDATRYGEYLHAPFQDFNTEHINHFSLICLSNLFPRHRFSLLNEGARTILAAPGKAYPVVYAVLQKQPIPDKDQVILRDTFLIQRIMEYIRRSQDLMDKMNARLETIIGECPEIIVWGTGQLAMKLLAETCLGQANIIAFVDGNPANWGRLLRGIPIKPPQHIFGAGSPILITSTLHQSEIECDIKRMGLPNVIFGLGIDS